MDITDIVSTEYREFSHDEPVSKLVGAFDDSSVKGVLVHNDGEFKGVVTRRQLAASHRPPDEKVGSLVWHVPRLAPNEDVRTAAQLMLDSDSKLLPVFEGDDIVGVVTVDDLLQAVLPHLDAATVEQVYSSDLVVVGPETTFGEALNTLRENRFTHLPVVEDRDVVGILSLHDLTELTTREMRQSKGGDAPGFDGHGGAGSSGGYRSHGGFGAREGERARMLDLPVRDLMIAPVRTVRPSQTLEDAVATMFDVGGSSLVVVSDTDDPLGIVTKTDVLRSLTWEAEGNRAVQILGASLLDDISYDEVVSMIDKFDSMDRELNVIDAKIHLHEHDETHRGTPLLLARIRLYTDRGLVMGSGEGYGASHAIHEARDVLERRIRDDKTYQQTKKHPDAEYWEKRFGWWLEE
ncbi:CBS domain-containing protein [Haloarchaeobius baliensis]|uniref:CBS domain-containing protein n=1 Tax=Haloarchaeobius baliensis TaxID=1670458 RepID=UPI003F883641